MNASRGTAGQGELPGRGLAMGLGTARERFHRTVQKMGIPACQAAETL